MGGMSADVWPSLVGSLSGALVGAVTAWVVSGRTLRGQAEQAAVQRLEAALSELILGVQALYGHRRHHPEESPQVPDGARVRVLLLTESEQLDAQLRWVCVGWLSRWRLLSEYVWDVASHNEDERMAEVDHALRRLSDDLVPALRKLKSPEPEHVAATLRALGEWLGRLETLEADHRNAAYLWNWQFEPAPRDAYEDAAMDSRGSLAELTALASDRELPVEEKEELGRRQRAVRLLDLREWSWANPLSNEELAERKKLEAAEEADWAAQRDVVARRRSAPIQQQVDGGSED